MTEEEKRKEALECAELVEISKSRMPDTIKAIKRLEKELGVKGTANVFRESLKLAKEAAAEAKR